MLQHLGGRDLKIGDAKGVSALRLKPEMWITILVIVQLVLSPGELHWEYPVYVPEPYAEVLAGQVIVVVDRASPYSLYAKSADSKFYAGRDFFFNRPWPDAQAEDLVHEMAHKQGHQHYVGDGMVKGAPNDWWGPTWCFNIDVRERQWREVPDSYRQLTEGIDCEEVLEPIMVK